MIVQTARKERLLFSLLLFAFLCVLMPGFRGWEGDMGQWVHWAIYDAQEGLPYAYDTDTNYTPLYHYALWLFGVVMRTPEAIAKYVPFLRVFTLVAEFWGCYLVYRWCGRKTDYVVILLLSILNIGYSYNTLLWGQVDAIPAAFSFAALYCLHRGRTALSGAMIVLALNMKLQSIIFLPLWGLLCIEYLIRTRRWRDAGLTLLLMAATQALILLPFAFSPRGLEQVWHNAVTLVGAYQEISVNAYNAWYFVFPTIQDHLKMTDAAPFIGGLSYREAGLMTFFIGAFAAFVPLLRTIFLHIRGKRPPAPASEVIFLTAALTALLFFFLNTEMHERYAHPAAIFLSAYAFYTRRWAAFVLFSIAYFLNLEGVMHWLALPNYGTLLFAQQFVAGLFALTIVLLFRDLYRCAARHGREAALETQAADSRIR